MKYFIYGSKDFALVLRDFLESQKKEFCGFIDDFATGEEFVGSFAKVIQEYDPEQYEIVLGIGYKNLSARWNIFKKIKVAGFNVATLIHERAYVRDLKNVGEGSIVMANSCVDCNAVLDKAVVLWPGTVVNHDSRIGENSFLSPNSTICGFVSIGKNTFVGAGATVVDHQIFAANSFVKAGSLAMHNPEKMGGSSIWKK